MYFSGPSKRHFPRPLLFSVPLICNATGERRIWYFPNILQNIVRLLVDEAQSEICQVRLKFDMITAFRTMSATPPDNTNDC